jgi:hypothetical protein
VQLSAATSRCSWVLFASKLWVPSSLEDEGCSVTTQPYALLAFVVACLLSEEERLGSDHKCLSFEGWN